MVKYLNEANVQIPGVTTVRQPLPTPDAVMSRERKGITAMAGAPLAQFNQWKEALKQRLIALAQTIEKRKLSAAEKMEAFRNEARDIVVSELPKIGVRYDPERNAYFVEEGKLLDKLIKAGVVKVTVKPVEVKKPEEVKPPAEVKPPVTPPVAPPVTPVLPPVAPPVTPPVTPVTPTVPAALPPAPKIVPLEAAPSKPAAPAAAPAAAAAAAAAPTKEEIIEAAPAVKALPEAQQAAIISAVQAGVLTPEEVQEKIVKGEPIPV
jgi:hypothetical protein